MAVLVLLISYLEGKVKVLFLLIFHDEMLNAGRRYLDELGIVV